MARIPLSWLLGGRHPQDTEGLTGETIALWRELRLGASQAAVGTDFDPRRMLRWKGPEMRSSERWHERRRRWLKNFFKNDKRVDVDA